MRYLYTKPLSLHGTPMTNRLFNANTSIGSVINLKYNQGFFYIQKNKESTPITDGFYITKQELKESFKEIK